MAEALPPTWDADPAAAATLEEIGASGPPALAEVVFVAAVVAGAAAASLPAWPATSVAAVVALEAGVSAVDTGNAPPPAAVPHPHVIP